MSSYKLHYFNGRGRAEVSRLIFASVGQKFEDIRYDQSQWPTIQPKMPLGQLPVLEYDGTVIPQSLSIARFLAKKFNLAGRDQLEQAKVDAAVDTISDAVVNFVPIASEKDEAKKKEGLRKYLAEDLPYYLQNLENLARMYSQGGPFFLGNQLTWADLYLYDVGETILQADCNVFNNYLWIKRNRQTVERNSNIAAYLASRPKTFF